MDREPSLGGAILNIIKAFIFIVGLVVVLCLGYLIPTHRISCEDILSIGTTVCVINHGFSGVSDNK